MALIFDPAVHPSFPLGDDTKFNVLKATFGDDYSQRTPAGLNNRKKTATFTWINLTTAEKDGIVDFMETSEGSEPFDYTLPTGDTTRWIALGVRKETTDSGNWNVSVEVEKVNDL